MQAATAPKPKVKEEETAAFQVLSGGCITLQPEQAYKFRLAQWEAPTPAQISRGTAPAATAAQA
jgi:hypothetical protein